MEDHCWTLFVCTHCVCVPVWQHFWLGIWTRPCMILTMMSENIGILDYLDMNTKAY